MEARWKPLGWLPSRVSLTSRLAVGGSLARGLELKREMTSPIQRSVFNPDSKHLAFTRGWIARQGENEQVVAERRGAWRSPRSLGARR